MPTTACQPKSNHPPTMNPRTVHTVCRSRKSASAIEPPMACLAKRRVSDQFMASDLVLSKSLLDVRGVLSLAFTLARCSFRGR